MYAYTHIQALEILDFIFVKVIMEIYLHIHSYTHSIIQFSNTDFKMLLLLRRKVKIIFLKNHSFYCVMLQGEAACSFHPPH